MDSTMYHHHQQQQQEPPDYTPHTPLQPFGEPSVAVLMHSTQTMNVIPQTIITTNQLVDDHHHGSIMTTTHHTFVDDQQQSSDQQQQQQQCLEQLPTIVQMNIEDLYVPNNHQHSNSEVALINATSCNDEVKTTVDTFINDTASGHNSNKTPIMVAVTKCEAMTTINGIQMRSLCNENHNAIASQLTHSIVNNGNGESDETSVFTHTATSPQEQQNIYMNATLVTEDLNSQDIDSNTETSTNTTNLQINTKTTAITRSRPTRKSSRIASGRVSQTSAMALLSGLERPGEKRAEQAQTESEESRRPLKKRRLNKVTCSSTEFIEPTLISSSKLILSKAVTSTTRKRSQSRRNNTTSKTKRRNQSQQTIAKSYVSISVQAIDHLSELILKLVNRLIDNTQVTVESLQQLILKPQTKEQLLACFSGIDQQEQRHSLNELLDKVYDLVYSKRPQLEQQLLTNICEFNNIKQQTKDNNNNKHMTSVVVTTDLEDDFSTENQTKTTKQSSTNVNNNNNRSSKQRKVSKRKRKLKLALGKKNNHNVDGDNSSSENDVLQKCSVADCLYTSMREWAVREHYKQTHSDNKQYGCKVDGCPMSFLSSLELDNHMKRQHTEEASKEFMHCTWPGCKSLFKSKLGLRAHLINHRGENIIPCNWSNCGYIARSKRQSENHMRKHTGDRPYICDFPGCDSKFRTSDSLRHHRKTHSEFRPFKCDWPGCDTSFKSNRALTIHRALHTGEKLFKCEWSGCDFASERKYQVDLHLYQAHTHVKPYRCDWDGCSASFLRNDKLQNHLMIHRKEKPIQCIHPDCDRAFIEKGNMLKHYNNVHKPRQVIT